MKEMKNKKTSKISDAILEGENLSTRISGMRTKSWTV